MRRGSHTPNLVGRRIASRIPPAHIVSLLTFTPLHAGIEKLLGGDSFPELSREARAGEGHLGGLLGASGA